MLMLIILKKRNENITLSLTKRAHLIQKKHMHLTEKIKNYIKGPTNGLALLTSCLAKELALSFLDEEYDKKRPI